MLQSGRHRSVLLLALALSGCFLLTSCSSIPFADSIFGGAAYDIKLTVADYLDQISSGMYANLKYTYFSVADSKFAELTFANNDAAEIMDKGMKKTSYKIEDAEGSTKDREGSCRVTITSVDVEEVLSGFDDKGMQKDDLLDALSDTGVPTIQTEITLNLIYNTAEKIWMISDTGPLAAVLGDPYTNIVLVPDAGSPAAVVETFLIALAERDKQAAVEAAPCCEGNSLLFEDPGIKGLSDEYYGRLTYQYVSEDDHSDLNAEVIFSITMPDFEAAAIEQIEDIAYLASELKPSLLISLQGGDTSAADQDEKVIQINDLADRLADVSCITSNMIFKLEKDVQSGKWVVSSIPPELYNASADLKPYGANFTKAAILALDELLDEGSIDQETHDNMSAILAESLSTENAEEKGYSFEGTWSVPGGEYVSGSFDAATTTGILYWMFFDKGIPEDTNFTYEWYNENGTVLLSSSTEFVAKGHDAIDPVLSAETYGALLPPDTYKLVVKISDGTIIASSWVSIV